MRPRELPTPELIDALRHAAAIWFKNDDLLLLEELIRRMQAPAPKEASNAGR